MKNSARFRWPLWVFMSIIGVVAYFVISSRLVAPEKSVKPGETASSAKVGPSTESGGLVFSPATRELKAEPGDDSVLVHFTVQNQTDQAIPIASLRSGCACLAVSIDRDPVPAKGNATITGEFDISDLRGTSVKSISVKPAGGARPVVLSTTIEVDEIYTLEESLTTWKVGSDPETKVIEFRVLRDRPIHVLSAASQREEVTCELEVIEEGRAYKLHLTPDSTESALLGFVRLETDCELESYARPLAYFSIQR